MNGNSVVLCLRDFMGSPEGWGRIQGREVYQRLIEFVEDHPGVMVFKVSLAGVRRMDISFTSETLIELARRYRGFKGFCIVDMTDPDMLENLEAAALRKRQPMMIWQDERLRVIGVAPSRGNLAAFRFALERPTTTTSEVASALGMKITNASTKLKQLWEQGFLLRREDVAASGGVEYTYYRIG